MIKTLIEHLVKQIVEKPAAVEVIENDEGGKKAITIRIAQEDRGKVIGKEGHTIRALRTIVNAAAPSETTLTVDVA